MDPLLVFARLPQPYRSVAKVLDSILDDAWTIVERPKSVDVATPDVVVDFGAPISCACLSDDVVVVATGGELTVASRSIKLFERITAMSVFDGRVAVGGQGLAVVNIDDLRVERYECDEVDGVWLGDRLVAACKGSLESFNPNARLATGEGCPTVHLAGSLCHWPNSNKCVRFSTGEELVMPGIITSSAVARRRLALGLDTGTVLLWDLRLDICSHILKRHSAPTTRLAFAQNHLVTSASNGFVHVYDLDETALVAVHVEQHHQVQTPLVTTSTHALVGSSLYDLDAPQAPPRCLFLQEEGTILAADTTTFLVAQNTRLRLFKTQHDGPPSRLREHRPPPDPAYGAVSELQSKAKSAKDLELRSLRKGICS